jgi:hypothetical protein
MRPGTQVQDAGLQLDEQEGGLHCWLLVPHLLWV